MVDTNPLEIFLTFARFGLIAFGGALAILPEMGRELVDVRGWMTAQTFTDGYALGQFSPGPNMLAVVFYGFKAGGVLGGIAAGLGMFGPSAMVAALLSSAWNRLGDAPWPNAVRAALLPIGSGLMVAGVVALARGGLTDLSGVIIAVAGLLAVLSGRVNSIAAVIAGGLIGAVLGAVK
jgi:chromate transporter